jgi:hypothetical protein
MHRVLFLLHLKYLAMTYILREWSLHGGVGDGLLVGWRRLVGELRPW